MALRLPPVERLFQPGSFPTPVGALVVSESDKVPRTIASTGATPIVTSPATIAHCIAPAPNRTGRRNRKLQMHRPMEWLNPVRPGRELATRPGNCFAKCSRKPLIPLHDQDRPNRTLAEFYAFGGRKR